MPLALPCDLYVLLGKLSNQSQGNCITCDMETPNLYLMRFLEGLECKLGMQPRLSELVENKY